MYDESAFIRASINGVVRTLVEGIALVIVVLFLFLGDLRSSLIVIATLVLTPALTFLVMNRHGISANLMSLGGLATHLANIPHWGGTILNDTAFGLAAAPPPMAEKTSRADVLAHFDETVRATRAWLDKTDAELVAPWTLRRGGQEMFSLPRVAAFRSFVLYHIVHHRGQLSVYLRLNDVPVPAIYGPSADES